MGFRSPSDLPASTVMLTGKVLVGAVSAACAPTVSRTNTNATESSSSRRKETPIKIRNPHLTIRIRESLQTSTATKVFGDAAAQTLIILVRLEPPVHVSFIGHGFMHEREQVRVVGLQR